MKILQLIALFLLLLTSCKQTSSDEFFSKLETIEKIEGKAALKNRLFLSAGNKLYVLGLQSGSFPAVDSNIAAEMGGVWLRPIKLLDGYHSTIKNKEAQVCLTESDQFFTYTVGSEQIFQVDKVGITVSQFHFVPENQNGLIVAYQIENNTTTENKFELSFNAAIDLRSVSKADSVGVEDGQDEGEWKNREGIFVAKDKKNNWFTVLGGRGFKTSEVDNSCIIESKGKGFVQSLTKNISLKGSEKQLVYFVVSGSSNNQKEAVETHQYLSKNAQLLLSEKIGTTHSLNQTTQLNTRDTDFNQMFSWAKYNAEWSMQELASNAECQGWFGSNSGFVVQGLLAAGMHEKALKTIDLIVKLSKQENGKPMQKVNTKGLIFNADNINATSKFVNILWKAYAWTGEKHLLEYYDLVKNAVVWVEAQDKNKYPDELAMIDRVAYQYEMYVAAANFASVKQESVLANEYKSKAAEFKMKINSEWWVEDSNSYADFQSTKAHAYKITKEAIIRADSMGNPWLVNQLKNTLEAIDKQEIAGAAPFAVQHHWIVNTPMEVGAADRDKAQKALKTAEDYAKQLSASDILPIGIQAIAEAKYGNVDNALTYLKTLQNPYTLSSSVNAADTKFGVMQQAWDVYSVAVPVVEVFFGIHPKAWKSEISFTPNLPTEWTDVNLKNVKIGNNHLDISAKRIGNTMEFKLSQRHNWKMTFEFPEAKYIIYDGNRIKGGKVTLYDRVHNLKVEF